MNEIKNPWQIRGEKKIYDNPWIRVTEYDVINPSGGEGIYGKVHFKNLAIGVLPIDEKGYTWIVGQYRFTLNQYSWEMPEGGGPFSEDPLDAAKRELAEETGLSATEWIQLPDMHLSNSVSDERAIVFIARQLSQGEAHPEETEALQLKKIHFDELYQMVVTGQVTDVLTVAAVLRVKLMQLHGEISF